MPDIRFADSGRFPNDTIDGETVLIDAEKGHLFLFTGIGPQIWQRLGSGISPEALVDEIASRYGESAAAPTRTFLASLEAAEMLRRDAPTDQSPAPDVSWPSAFVAPALEQYDQIADIISMDPIHEVDSSKGWPRRDAEKR
jgi:hypothetical protein